jgi:hypothetical protein
MRRVVLAACLALAPLMVGAGIIGDPKVGNADPRTEHLGLIGDDIRIGARLLFDGTDEPAAEIDRRRTVLLEVGFLVNDKSADRAIRLHCRIRFVDPTGAKGDAAKDGLCYQGQLADLKGKWIVLPLNFRFKPQKADPNGTWGVEVAISDEETAEGVVLMPTYRWTGGPK